MRLAGLTVIALLVVDIFSQAITLVTPNGNETYEGDQEVTITWQADASISNFRVDYSLTNGTAWTFLDYTSAKSYTWYIPFLENTCGSALVRVTAQSIANPPSDVSDAPFTINKTAAVDPYEPNDDPASAFSAAIGTTLSGALLFGGQDTLDTAAKSYNDVDYYKFDLPGARLVTIKTSPEYTTSAYNRSDRVPFIMLHDASGNWLAAGYNGSITYNASSAGTFYCKVECVDWANYGITVDTSRSNGITVVFPNGGETFDADEAISVSWQADASISSFSIDYSLTNGATWWRIASTSLTSYTWYIPYLKSTCSSVLVRVTAENVANPPSDVSDAPFTINKAAAADPYEPNDNLSTAFTVSIDSVLRGAMVFGIMDTLTDSLNKYNDVDYYKFDLPGPRLAIVRTLPEYSGSAYDRSGSMPYVTLHDASGNRLAGSINGIINYNAMTAGTLYCKVVCGSLWEKYGLHVTAVTMLAAQTASFESAAVQKVTDSAYTVTVAADTTDLVINLTLNAKTGGSITTATLAADELSEAPGSAGKVKAISVTADSGIMRSLTTAEIAIPYNESDLGGAPEKSIVLLWLDDSAGQWSPVEFRVDTAVNVITALTTHFSVFGVFTDPATAAAAVSAGTTPASGMKAAYLGGRMSVNIACNPLTVRSGMLRLYAVNGRLVKEGVVPIGQSGRSTAVFDCRVLRSGIYMLTFNGGAYHTRTAVTVMK